MTPALFLRFAQRGGTCLPHRGPAIRLATLYDALTAPTLAGPAFCDREILAVVAFGSAFQPIPRKVERRRRYLFWGPFYDRRVVLPYHQPNDADFLVILRKPLDAEKHYDVVGDRDNYGGFWIRYLGVHCIARSLQQFVDGARGGVDSVSASACAHGIVLAAVDGFAALVAPLVFSRGTCPIHEANGLLQVAAYTVPELRALTEAA